MGGREKEREKGRERERGEGGGREGGRAQARPPDRSPLRDQLSLPLLAQTVMAKIGVRQPSACSPTGSSPSSSCQAVLPIVGHSSL